MDENKSKINKLDDFWDISALVPKSSPRYSQVTPKAPASITLQQPSKAQESNEESDTVIKRYIPPHSASERLSSTLSFLSEETYTPRESLIHSVTLKKLKTQYNYYCEFVQTALKYKDATGSPCEYVPFFSYVPQYDQMNREQFSYYLWFRDCARRGKYIKADQGYLFLYIFELINLGDKADTKASQYILTSLWNEYHDKIPSVTSKLALWICDYSLLHRLPPPINAGRDMIQSTSVLKEFYISLPDGDMMNCALSLIRYCSSYDFRTSKFFNADNSELFEKMILGALAEAVKFYSSDGEILSGISFGDSYIERDAFAGALCSASQRYRIEVKYCSFSRSNELRFLVGDIIKYSENKLRAFFGIKSKMTVYSVSGELRALLDNYFSQNLPSKHIKKAVKEERHDYDVLYDVPQKKLSLSDAAKIEEDSWLTTKGLVEAFEEQKSEVEITLPDKKIFPTEVITENKKEDDGFGEYRSLLVSMLNGNQNALKEFASKINKMPDAVADEINERAYDIIGDAVIEDDGMGAYVIIEDYRYLFE